MMSVRNHDSTGPNAPRAEVRETHSAVVLLMGEHAYKMKKSVNLGFLDFRSDQSRREVCLRELELNTRLAPDVYLDVIAVAGPDGRSYEHGVLMRRMPEELRLSTMIGNGVHVDDHLNAVARLIARFHASAKRSPQIAAEGVAVGLRRRWTNNLRESEQYRGKLLAEPLYERIAELALRYIDGRVPLLAERAAAGLVVDGHGDLLAEDIFCLPDYPRVLDCLEFDDRLRWLDVLDDVAFLAMDVEYLGRPDLAAQFLSSYIEYSGTPDVSTLRHHYIAYRAFVRAKVMCIQAAQGRQDAVTEIDRYARLALGHLEAGEVGLTLVGGAPGTGKTTLARGLAERLGVVLLSSDTVRAGLSCPAGDRYTESAKAANYHELLVQAGRALAHGDSVIADATWGDLAMRDLAEQTAARTSSRLTALECAAPVEVAVARARRRSDDGTDASEAGADVARTLAAARRPWPGAIPVDTSRSAEESLEHAVAAATAGTTVRAG